MRSRYGVSVCYASVSVKVGWYGCTGREVLFKNTGVAMQDILRNRQVCLGTGVIVGGMEVTRKSFPEAFSLAQSKGECPGASTTFCLGLFAGGNVDTESPSVAEAVLLRRGRVIVGGGISNEVAAVGIILGVLMAGALGVVGSEESSFSGDG